MTFTRAFEWEGVSEDPNDEGFGHVVEPTRLSEASAFDAVLVGEAYDGAVIGRRGAGEAPEAIRSALAATKTEHLGRGAVSGVGDLGDIDLPEAPPSTVQEAVRVVTREVHATAALPVFLGGDNSLTYPNVRPLLDRPTGVVSLDAHLDCREVRGEPTSGSPYRQLFDAGLETLCVVGARHFETSTAYHEYLEKGRGRVVTAESVEADLSAALDRVTEALAGVERVYVSLDLDVLDASAAPGVSAPTPGGLTTRETFRLLRWLAADDRLAGFEVVECAPPLDRDGRTVAAAARAIAHVLSGWHDPTAAVGEGRP
jgi:formiminoglutamase/agmatinase